MTDSEPPRVLIATVALTGFGGTDLYTRDLALSLLRHGWMPVVYSTNHGRLANELRDATIPVVGNLDAMTAAPDIIQGHHILETLAAMARFPGVPAIFVCHDAHSWHSAPPVSSRIVRYVAVDRNCRDRMMLEYGIPEESIRVMPNAVELRRFTARPPLPAKPHRALVFSNDAKENTWAAPIAKACQRRDIALDIVGLGSGRYAERPEEIVGQYDIVFGKARCALESLVTGAAVVACDRRGLGGMVTTANLEQMRHLNFGIRTLTQPITVETVLTELDRYDPADAGIVSKRMRARADVDRLALDYIEIYEQVRATAAAVSTQDDLRAMSRSLERVMSLLNRSATHPPLLRLRRFVASSRILAVPARLLYRLKHYARS